MIQPIIHQHLTHIFMRHYGRSPENAAAEASKLLEVLQAYGMDVIKGEWLVPEPIKPTREQIIANAERAAYQWAKEMKEPLTWETLASRAAELEERRPWNPPELQ